MTNNSDKFLKLIQILKDLRSPDGCDWDKEQTHESLMPYLLEEVYEVIEAIENKDYELLKEELGDCLYYLTNLITDSGSSLEEVMEINSKKVQELLARRLLGE